MRGFIEAINPKQENEAMTIKEQIVAKVMLCGYGFVQACEMAESCLSEFKASGLKSMEFGVMGANGKCLDVIRLQKD